MAADIAANYLPENEPNPKVRKATKKNIFSKKAIEELEDIKDRISKVQRKKKSDFDVDELLLKQEENDNQLELNQISSNSEKKNPLLKKKVKKKKKKDKQKARWKKKFLKKIRNDYKRFKRNSHHWNNPWSNINNNCNNSFYWKKLNRMKVKIKK